MNVVRIGAALLVVGCARPQPIEVVSRPVTATKPPARAPEPAPAPCCAPEGALFLMERGVVTFEWTYEHPRVGAQQGQSRLAFDRWGRRQFTSGNPGPNSDQVVIVDTTKMTTYLPQQRSAVTLPWKAVEAFTPEERKLLEQAFPVNQLPATKTKVVAGIPCLETALERNLPGGGVLVHTACVGKGIILESTDSVTGGVMGDSRSHVIATKVDLQAEVPEAIFEIPADVPVLDMGKHYEDPSTRQRVLDAVRTYGAEKATPAPSDAPPADANVEKPDVAPPK